MSKYRYSTRPAIYADVVNKIHDGDIALYRAKQSLVNRIIARAGGTPYAHAGMIHQTTLGDLVLFETIQWLGGRKINFASQVQGWPGQWDIYRPRKSYDGEAAILKMASIVGRPYGWCNLCITALRHTRFISKLLPPLTDDQLNGSAPFCSQAVSRACRAGGVDPRPNQADVATEPGDLANPEFAKYLFTLYWSEDQIPKGGRR